MTAPHLLLGRMLEFNCLPSRTLHPSRYDTYALPGLAHAIPAAPVWLPAWHRHWSRTILDVLNIGMVENTRAPELAVGLLPPRMLSRLAHRVAAALCGRTIRLAIDGSQVRALQSFLGDELLAFARGEAVRYDALCAQRAASMPVPHTLHELEVLGYGVLLAGLSQTAPALFRRVELKCPIDTGVSEISLPTEQAWQLCLTVLKDMDPAWCSCFPDLR